MSLPCPIPCRDVCDLASIGDAPASWTGASPPLQTRRSRMHLRSHGPRCMRGAFRVVSAIASTASETARPHRPTLSAQRSACPDRLQQVAPRHTEVAPISVQAGSGACVTLFGKLQAYHRNLWVQRVDFARRSLLASKKLAACFPAAGARTGGRSQPCHQRSDTRRCMLGAHRETSNV